MMMVISTTVVREGSTVVGKTELFRRGKGWTRLIAARVRLPSTAFASPKI